MKFKFKPDDFTYSDEHDAWFCGDMNFGIGLFKDGDMWNANIVCGGDVTLVDGCFTRSHAMAESLKTYERLFDETQS